jgi:hypothetical protein
LLGGEEVMLMNPFHRKEIKLLVFSFLKQLIETVFIY